MLYPPLSFDDIFSLKEEFPVWYEKLVLEMVHHNTISLEKLVDTSWLEIMTKFAVGEECDFEVRPRLEWTRVSKAISLFWAYLFLCTFCHHVQKVEYSFPTSKLM